MLAFKVAGLSNDRSEKPKKLVSYSSLLDVIVGCGDMVLLDPLSEDKVVENLKLRYSKKDIYVRRLTF